MQSNISTCLLKGGNSRENLRFPYKIDSPKSLYLISNASNTNIMPKSFVNPEVEEYRRSLKSTLMTTRFNNATWAENQNYLQNLKTKYPNINCIYASPSPLSQSIPPNATIFVLEMNNEENQIMGIGLITNRIFYNSHNIYHETKYNTFSYTGKYRIDRKDLTHEELQIFKVFDNLCFKGKRHLKRLKGIKCFPIDMLYNCKSHAKLDLVEFLGNMFRNHIYTHKTNHA
jgi:hypothetical protein